MIRRGGRLSRWLAALTVAAPALLAAAAFGVWAVSGWRDAGARIAEADQARHEAIARASQARLYEPLAEAWRGYARTDVSGLHQAADAEAARSALIAHVDQLFARFAAPEDASEDASEDAENAAAPPAGRVVASSSADGDRDGLKTVWVEARGVLSEDALPRFLQAVETEPPYLFIERLEIARGDDPGSVMVRFRASGFRLEEGAL